MACADFVAALGNRTFATTKELFDAAQMASWTCWLRYRSPQCREVCSDSMSRNTAACAGCLSEKTRCQGVDGQACCPNWRAALSCARSLAPEADSAASVPSIVTTKAGPPWLIIGISVAAGVMVIVLVILLGVYIRGKQARGLAWELGYKNPDEVASKAGYGALAKTWRERASQQ